MTPTTLDTAEGEAEKLLSGEKANLGFVPNTLEAGAAVIAGLITGIALSPRMRAALRHGAVGLAVLLFLLSLRSSGERAGRLAERLETTEKFNDVQRRMLEAAASRPRDRDELAERLRDGRF